LDETVSGVLYSAFGHAGQKCSACSRVIVHNSLKDKLIERLRAAASDLKVGQSFKFDTTVNPVISAEDQKRLRQSVREASNEAATFGGSVVIDRSNDDLPGYCVGPAIIELPYARALDKESFAQKELFGPVVHIIGFNSLDDAAKLFNSTDYALTGGIFSQSQNDIDYLLTKIESGNIYINRTITGARVAIEPFGGFKLSGTGPKAGGRHYVLSMHQLNLRDTDKVEGSNAIEEGHDSPVLLKRPSKLSAQSRNERMEKFLSHFISSFETHYQGIFRNYKEVLRDYKKWLNKNFVNFIEKEHKNRVIPGQLSFNDYRLNVEHVLVVSTSDRPQLKTLIQVFSAVASGAGIAIACRNKASFQWWMNLRDGLFQAGFAKENLEVYFAKTSELVKAINDPKLSVIIYDGPMEEYSAHIGNFFDEGKNDQRMKLVLTINDYLKESDFYHQALNFVWVRALAVNTMRHGAPLDLEI
ncbi:MAG: aldehyde dehydrogenase family protein, partial [Bdellovibrionales bacterium]|nr:aldehyde dehydrogenase family protein [Bdellovibrionales bacterium]